VSKLSLAEDLRARLHDLATTLAAVDAIASGIRQRVALLVTPLQKPRIQILVGIDAVSGRATGAILRAHRRY
jgi:hypothetical protein